MTAEYFCGVMGWPLHGTLSPTIHNAAFRKLNLDWVYFAWPVPPESLAAAVIGLRALGAQGANVTMPHKEAVIDHLDQVSGDARAVGAVNTIQRYGERLIGHNTDIDGFLEFLSADAGIDAAGMSALVLGAGGSARAVVKALEGARTQAITIAARDAARATQVEKVAAAVPVRSVRWDEAADAASDVDLVVNATPLGSSGEDPMPAAKFHAGQVVVDLVYLPPATPMVERARAGGASAWGGLGMLVHQAAASIRIWTGMDPPLETMSAAALHGLRHHGARMRPNRGSASLIDRQDQETW
jgi:shikimate dehydrogenase